MSSTYEWECVCVYVQEQDSFLTQTALTQTVSPYKTSRWCSTSLWWLCLTQTSSLCKRRPSDCTSQTHTPPLPLRWGGNSVDSDIIAPRPLGDITGGKSGNVAPSQKNVLLSSRRQKAAGRSDMETRRHGDTETEHPVSTVRGTK